MLINASQVTNPPLTLYGNQWKLRFIWARSPKKSNVMQQENW
jgi:hypothetical protein